MNTTGFNKNTTSFIKDNKFQVDINQLLSFLFPPELQHPLTAGRLYLFGNCGPLDENGQVNISLLRLLLILMFIYQLRTGYKGNRILLDYELEEQCVQYEREDIIRIYQQPGSGGIGLLTSAEQEAIIAQADGHLKKAKGKAMLPRLTKQDVIDIFEDLPRDANGCFSFHEAQKKIHEFREMRIKEYKLVYPSIGGKKSKETNDSTMNKQTQQPTEKSVQSTALSLNNNKSKKPVRKSRVSDIVAPQTMFMRDKGNSNADMVEQTMKYLKKYAYKITDIDNKAGAELTYNIRLLREIEPRCKDPYKGKREQWDEQSQFVKGYGMGSKVDCIPSSSTYHQKFTKYQFSNIVVRNSVI